MSLFYIALASSQEHLNCMGIPQWRDYVTPGDPWPLWSFDAPKTVKKRLAGNGMHSACIGAVHCVVLSCLVKKSWEYWVDSCCLLSRLLLFNCFAHKLIGASSLLVVPIARNTCCTGKQEWHWKVLMTNCHWDLNCCTSQCTMDRLAASVVWQINLQNCWASVSQEPFLHEVWSMKYDMIMMCVLFHLHFSLILDLWLVIGYNLTWTFRRQQCMFEECSHIHGCWLEPFLITKLPGLFF